MLSRPMVRMERGLRDSKRKHANRTSQSPGNHAGALLAHPLFLLSSANCSAWNDADLPIRFFIPTGNTPHIFTAAGVPLNCRSPCMFLCKVSELKKKTAVSKRTHQVTLQAQLSYSVLSCWYAIFVPIAHLLRWNWFLDLANRQNLCWCKSPMRSHVVSCL